LVVGHSEGAVVCAKKRESEAFVELAKAADFSVLPPLYLFC
jgi:hypothetical protein